MERPTPTPHTPSATDQPQPAPRPLTDAELRRLDRQAMHLRSYTQSMTRGQRRRYLER